MRPWVLFVLALTAYMIVACASRSPQPGALQTFTAACDKPNEGQRIAVEGYLRLPDSFSGTDSVELRLYSDTSFVGQPIGVTMPFGNGPNRAEMITGSYRDDDLKVHLADGQLIPFGAKVRVSGRMYYPIIAQDFPCALENLYLEAAK